VLQDNLKLNGFFECQKSRCRQIKKTPFPCDRYCPRITTSGINVILFHGDVVLTAECSRGYTVNEYVFLLVSKKLKCSWESLKNQTEDFPENFVHVDFPKLI
jgi:hypothetical protein